MFAVIYRWRAAPGQEAACEEGWRRATLAIRRCLGGLGSRLHRTADGAYVAYAQWPDEATWKRAMDGGVHDDPEARDLFRGSLEGSVETLFAMPVAIDLLEPAP
jgi:hypothetical protein